MTYEQQAAFFRTFGALKVPGLFAPEVELLVSGFEQVFREHPAQEADRATSLHRVMDPEVGAPRLMITEEFVERSPKLSWLLDDPRITGLASALLGPDYCYRGSAGNLFNSYICWHSDYFHRSVPAETNVKFAFYLDDLEADSGALRVIPGSSHPGPFRSAIFDESTPHTLGTLEARFGVAEEDLPCWTIAVEPGDLVVMDYSILHANFNGGSHRRMFSLEFGQPEAAS